MNRTKVAILASTALCLSLSLAQEARAADLITKAKPVAAPIADPWTGFYIGANAGYSWGKADTTSSVDPFPEPSLSFTFPGSFSKTSLKPDGGIAGGQIGYLQRIINNWYVGFEGDFQWSGQKAKGQAFFEDSRPCTTPACEFSNTTDITAKLSWFATLRGTLGVDVNGLLVSVSGGLAHGRVSVSGLNTFFVTAVTCCTDITRTTSFSHVENKTGWAAGARIQGKLSRDLSWWIEYLHLDLGSIGGGTFTDGPVVLTVNTVKFTDDILRIGLNYRFATP